MMEADGRPGIPLSGELAKVHAFGGHPDAQALVPPGAYAAFAQGDIESVLGLLDENVEWNEAEHITYWPGGRSSARRRSSTASSRDTWQFAEATGVAPLQSS